jgi:arylsulfatase A-like enzyme
MHGAYIPAIFKRESSVPPLDAGLEIAGMTGLERSVHGQALEARSSHFSTVSIAKGKHGGPPHRMRYGVYGGYRLMMTMAMVVLLTAVTACRSTAPSPSGTISPDFSILIIVLDACRADKIGLYGFERETSPTIDALGRDPDAVVYRHHYVQGTWTKPSTASLFTGRLVHEHGVTMSHQKVAGRGRVFRTQVLLPSLYTMAEWLRDAGYVTFGIVKSPHLDPAYGFARGFREYYTPNDLPSEDRALATKFIDVLDRYPTKAFGYLHVNACHNPFPPLYRDPEYIARYGFPYDEPARQAARVDFTTADIKYRIREGTLELNDDDVRFLHLVYEAKLRWTDRQVVSPLLEALRAHNRYDNSLIILTADHGEELYDHKGFGHGAAVWDAVIHVPLIVKFPKGHKPPALPRDVTAVTGNVDLLPSLLAVLGIAPPKELPGRPVFEAVNGGTILAEQGIASGEIVEWALIQGDYKLIESKQPPRLFNLLQDPAERSNLAPAEPERVQALSAAAHRLRGATVQAPVVETQLAPAVIEQLRNLGYMKSDQ